MWQCHTHDSFLGCHEALDRRRFLRGLGTAAAMTVCGLTSIHGATDDKARKIRVAAVFLANTKIREIWPYPGFDAARRQQEVVASLEAGCPDVEFVPLTVNDPNGVQKAIALKDSVDGYLIYVVTLDWGLRSAIVEIGSDREADSRCR